MIASPATVERLFRDPVLPTELLVVAAGLRLFEDCDDLFFGKSFSLQVSFLLLPENSLWLWSYLRGGGQRKNMSGLGYGRMLPTIIEGYVRLS